MACPGDGRAQETETLPDLVVTASRIDVGLPGTTTTIIDEETIRRSPARSVPELLSLEAGIQSRDLFGATAGARGTVDLRGFGAAASQNALFLVNGRRLNAIDLAAIDFANIPLDSLERIEVIRGNSGAVLYGDGAVGGVINFVTKPSSRRKPGASAKIATGSNRYRSGDFSVHETRGPYTMSAYGSFVSSDGFRENNMLVQRNLIAELRRTKGETDVFLNLQVDDQSLELPGVRRVTLTTRLLESDPEGATTPFDQALQNGVAVTVGATRPLGKTMELILDAGIRRKDQATTFISNFGSTFDSFVDTELTTASFTPRIKSRHDVFGMSGNATAGIDVYFSDYNSDRKNNPGTVPIHQYDAKQTSLAAYAQQTVALNPETDLTAGVRVQRTTVKAGDIFDSTAPGASGSGDKPLDDGENEWAANLGIDRRLSKSTSLFGHLARAFRTPTIDERIGGTGTSLVLKTQKSYDLEAGGRFDTGAIFMQASAFFMNLRDEIHFDPNVNFGTNINLDPTWRYGVEWQGSFAVTDGLVARTSATYTRAQFTEGAFGGNDVPLVAPITLSCQIEWDVVEDVKLTGKVSYVGKKRLGNDQANFQPKIPAYTLVDVRLSGSLGKLTWSAQVNNLFDEDYFNYGVASASTFGTFNAYPLPGRTFLVRIGDRF